ncbi:hypothetical protein AA313_de0209714 [Arthrobotrys entomopaga]|nr:hypothetical protein AA313_de0209714 [Arthrobotrys entomopaga]
MVDSFDVTRNATAVGFWSIMESSLAVTIACLPAVNRTILGCCRRCRGVSEDGSGQRVSNKHGIIRFDGKIYKGHAKYISYSAAATADGTVRSYIELAETQPSSEEQLGKISEERKPADSYPDITVERSFQVIEERASVIDHEEAQRAEAIAQPLKARFFSGCRRSSPTSCDDSEIIIIKK